jgi:hypothetical protein
MKMVQRILLKYLCYLALACFGHQAFAQPPTITSVEPMTGPERRNVSVFGTNFSTVTNNTRTLRLNGVALTIQSTSNTRLVFTVPVGATSGPISVQVPGGTATTATDFIVAPGAPPANDNFANAQPLFDAAGSFTGNTANATKETGEPNHGGVPGGASVWFTWTAPSTGKFLFNPHDTVASNFGVNLAIYTGTEFSNLTQVASGLAGITSSRYQSAAALNATAGVTYYIAIDGYTGLTGDFKLTWAPLAPLAITSFVPAVGVYAGQAFNIIGTGFVPGMQVSVGGVPISSSRFSINSSTLINVTQMPYLAPVGASTVTITGSVVGSASAPYTVLAPPAPVIASFTPTTGTTNTQVTITGTALWLGDSTPTTVSFNGTYATQYTFTNSSTISARVPAGATTGPITVQTPGGSVVSATLFQVPGSYAPPVINSFSPAVATTGTPIAISGQNFLGTTGVSFNGIPAVFSVDAAGVVITTTVPAGAQTGIVTVTNPGGTGTSPYPFFVVNGPPTITSFQPSTITNGGFVQIVGTGFINVQSVMLNGTPVEFSFESPTELIAFVPATGALTNGPITVTNAVGQGTSSGSFTYLPAPAISGFSPTTIAPGMQVVITGTGLNNNPSVSFNGVSAASVIVNSSTQITAIVPSDPLTNGPITVTTMVGSATSDGAFIYAPPSPIIAGFSPTALAPGSTVTITGSNFGTVQAVLFNGSNAAAFTQNSATQITATAPVSFTAGPIIVITSSGTAISSTQYTIAAAPVITGMTPSFGPTKRIVSVSGTNFNDGANAPNVRLNGIPVGALSRSNTLITFAVPVGATTGPITIQTSQGLGVSPASFTVATGPAPANDNFASATIISGVSGTISGNTANATKEPGEPNHADNAGGASVWFTWVAPQDGWFLFNPQAPSTSTSSPYGITQSIYTGSDVASLTRVASGLTPTSVFARFGSAATLNAVSGTTYRIALDGYNGVMPDYRLAWSPLVAPAVGSFSGTSAQAGQTVTVNINGANFAPGATVSFGGGLVDPARITYQSSSQITVLQVPITAVTGPITVTTPAGSATSAGIFTVIPPPAPIITALEFSGAKAGTPMTITGTNFTGATAVLFNGTPAIFTVNAPGQIISTTVPAGATSGYVQVVAAGGTATSPMSFTVITPPVITTQPVNQVATALQSASFTVVATSNGPLEYSWHKEGGSLATNPTAFNSTLVISPATPSDAGTYYCQVGNNAGIIETIRVELVVQRAPATVILSGLNPTYDGTPKAPIVTTIPAGLPVQILYHGLESAPVNAGAYTVGAIITDPLYDGGAGDTLVIAKAYAVVALGHLTATYNGMPQPATATTVPAGLNVNLTYNGSSTPPTNAGSYGVAALVSDANYQGSVEGGLYIAPVVTTFAVSNIVQIYNGTPRTVTVATTPASVATAITFNSNPTAPTNAGTYHYEINVTNPNYTGATGGTLTIEKAAATVALGNLSTTYDGQPHGPTAITTPAGLGVSFTYTGAASTPVNAGFYPVTATVNDANYTGSTTGTMGIAKAIATVALSGLTQTYDGSARVVTATTTPAGLPVVVLYNGGTAAPVVAGSYSILASVPDENYSGSATGTLVIAKSTATIALSDLVQAYDGTPRIVTATTTPAGVSVTLTYNGAATAPTNPGSYAVVATVDDTNQTGTVAGTLVVTIPALVRHAPSINGGLDGSVQVLLGEDLTLNSSAFVSGDVLVVGTPTVQINGHPTYVGTRDGTGSVTPANYRVTLNGSAVVRYLVRRTDALSLPTVSTPPATTGTRDVSINAAGQSAGDFATLRNLTLNSNAGTITAPAGTYGNFTANGSSVLVLGVAGATTPAVYNLQGLTLNGTSQVQVVGPVVINLASGVSLNGSLGNSAHPEWVALNVAAGGVTLNSNVSLHGYVTAPNGTVTINGNSVLRGGVVADRLTINSNGLLDKVD